MRLSRMANIFPSLTLEFMSLMSCRCFKSLRNQTYLSFLLWLLSFMSCLERPFLLQKYKKFTHVFL